jgi:death-on-curing protein
MTFLTVGDTLALHEEVIKVSGGSAGVRDMGAVESAVAQPQVTFGGQKLYSTLDEKAAALSFSLVKTTPLLTATSESDGSQCVFFCISTAAKSTRTPMKPNELLWLWQRAKCHAKDGRSG